MSLHSDSIQPVRQTYSEKKLAIDKALPYSQQEREEIYVWEQLIDTDKHEYTLRTRADIINPHSDQIVYTEPYVEQPALRFKTISGERKLIGND